MDGSKIVGHCIFSMIQNLYLERVSMCGKVLGSTMKYEVSSIELDCVIQL